MKKVILATDKYFTLSEIDPRIYGSFIEHMGRAVYGGLYDPTDVTADGKGFRRDVIAAVRELGVPVVRYPGGNVVSNYRWEDGVGDRSQRPVRLEAAWQSIEDNSFGLNEFMDWAKRADTAPMMAVNLGTRGASDAANLLEYCNYPGGTYYSDLRRSHGYDAPHGIKLWCLGNEMDGPWQIGHKTAEEYGSLAAQTGMLMKKIDPSIELAACGSAGRAVPTFGAWDATVAERTYDFIDYLSAHIYFNNANKTEQDSAEFLAGALELEEQIRSVVAACDYARAKLKKKKSIHISLDEWNVVYRPHGKVPPQIWTKAPHEIEDIYSLEDALVVGSVLITMHNHADRVKIGCLAQLVNVIAPILTGSGTLAKQTIFYPFADASRYGRGTALCSRVVSPTYTTKKYGEVPCVTASVVDNAETGELAVFVVNRSLTEPFELESDLRQYKSRRIAVNRVFTAADIKAQNTLEHPDAVLPRDGKDATFDDGVLRAVLAPHSWNVIVLK